MLTGVKKIRNWIQILRHIHKFKLEKWEKFWWAWNHLFFWDKNQIITREISSISIIKRDLFIFSEFSDTNECKTWEETTTSYAWSMGMAKIMLLNPFSLSGPHFLFLSLVDLFVILHQGNLISDTCMASLSQPITLSQALPVMADLPGYSWHHFLFMTTS